MDSAITAVAIPDIAAVTPGAAIPDTATAIPVTEAITEVIRLVVDRTPTAVAERESLVVPSAVVTPAVVILATAIPVIVTPAVRTTEIAIPVAVLREPVIPELVLRGRVLLEPAPREPAPRGLVRLEPVPPVLAE